MKTCSLCGVCRPLDMFRLERGKPRTDCKVCGTARDRARYQANKEKIREQGKAHYQANKDRYKDYARAWAAANPEKRKEIGRVGSRAYYQRNPDKAYAANKVWLTKNPGKRATYNSRGRAARLLRQNTVWDKELDDLVMAEAADLRRLREKATGFEWHIDHTVPLLAKDACGLHNAFNIAVVPAVYNIRKKNKFISAPGFVVESSP